MTPSVPVGHDGGLSPALLSALAELDDPQGVSMPRLAKHLGLPGSAVLRGLHLLSGAAVGGQPGPGWVRVAQDDSRWLAWLTDAGRQQLANMEGRKNLPAPRAWTTKAALCPRRWPPAACSAIPARRVLCLPCGRTTRWPPKYRWPWCSTASRTP